jgi:hypothetical protein
MRHTVTEWVERPLEHILAVLHSNSDEYCCHMCVTIDGLWIHDGIYWTERDYALQFTITYTHTHTVVSTVTSSIAVAW